MQTFIISFVVSLVTTLLIVRCAHAHSAVADHDLTGVQKFHEHPVPRVGGLGIFLATLATGGLILFYDTEYTRDYWLTIVAALPAFLGGLIEDLTKRVGAGQRLVLSMLGASLGYLLLDAGISRVDIAWVDQWITWWPLAFLLTIVAVAGITNAINIIDGFNGLASAVSIMYFLSLAYVCFQVQDIYLLYVCLAMVGGILGFFLFNWPRGLIFLGDGGAYLIGFMLAEVSVLLVARNPAVSAWFPLTVMLYPIVETLFSIYRRKYIRGRSPHMPDGVHLHSLIFRRIVRWVGVGAEVKSLTIRNSLTSPYLWILSSASVLPAVLLWQKPDWLALFAVLFVICYVSLYWRIVRFRTPFFLKKKVSGS